MSQLFDRLERWLAIIWMLLALALAASTEHYRRQVTARDVQLDSLSAAIERQSHHAAQTLATLTAQRDAAQAALDAAYQQQEMADATAQQEIARLASELEQRPVRVRIATPATPAHCGGGRGSAPGNAPTAAHAGAADAAPTYGLLPAANSARLGAVIAEIETLSAAYTSCRAQLMHP